MKGYQPNTKPLSYDDNKPTDEEKASRILASFSSLENERSSWDSRYKSLVEYILPERGFFNGDTVNNGARTDEKRLETSQTKAAKVCAAGMHSGLTSPSRIWFEMKLSDKETAKLDEVKAWLEDSKNRILSVLSGSNFYPMMHNQYLEVCVFGTSVFLIEEDDETVIRCKTLTVGEYFLNNDARGKVNTMYRKIKMQPRQIVERFPDTAPEQIKVLCKNTTIQWLDVIHAIEPRKQKDREPNKIDGKNKRFSSTYVLNFGDKPILEEDGFDEMPVCCSRWEVSGSGIYGVSPGMDALPNIKSVQKMRENGFSAVELEAKPPMNVSSGLKNQSFGQFGLSPGHANFVDTNSIQPQISPTYQARSNLAPLDVWLQDYNKQIGESFYNDVFQVLANLDKGMTATEVSERVAEKLLQLGPVIERMGTEMHQPAIERIFNIMVE